MFTRLYKVDFSDLVKTLDDLMSEFVTVDESPANEYSDVKEEKSMSKIELEVPGVAKDKIKVRSEDGVVIVEGTNRRGKEFKRRYHLRDHEVEAATATIKDGLLTIKVPKTVGKARDIPLKIE